MSLKWKLLLAIVILWICGIVGVVMTAYENPTPPSGSTALLEAIKVGFIALGGLGVVLPTYLNIWNSLESQKSLDEDIRLKKVENTYQLIERWDTSPLFLARRYTRNLRKEKIELQTPELIKQIESDPDLKESVILVFNYFESLRLSIKHERVLVEFLKDSMRDAFLEVHHTFSPWATATQSRKSQDDIQDVYDIFSKK